jgi:proton-dependent oligopeptide transporter, POT family
LGRFNTIAVSVAIALVGYLLLISSIPPVILHPSGALTALCISVVVIVSILEVLRETFRYSLPNNSATLALSSHTEPGERVIADPTYFSFFINVGAFAGQRSMTAVEKV